MVSWRSTTHDKKNPLTSVPFAGRRKWSFFSETVVSMTVQVEDVRIRATYSQRKRVPITEGFVEVKDGGNEADLSDCKLGGRVEVKGNSTCEEGMPVVVSCVPGRAFAPTVSAGFRKAYRVEQPLVRLRGGAMIGEGAGGGAEERRVGHRVRRQLEPPGGHSGMGPVHMNEVECSGFEKSLTECSFNGEATGCGHEEDTAVKCHIPAMGFNSRVSAAAVNVPTRSPV
ncbi:hypothetical protein CRUP_002589 [Coryphaenoides rupestris]|nr:hypothetical protein CRUP_002589 [Coryphaenoides rupestris]